MLSQCSNFVSMRLTNAEDQGVIKRLLPDSLGGFSDILPTLDTGEALVVGDASLLPSRIRIDEPQNKPNSGTVDFWDEWQKPVKDTRLSVAVDNWRKQNIQ
ncbi:ATP-binding protein, partial [Vibrio anguillarum]|nr:ATP-binding protein [Vibrio anguillarum]